MPTIPTATKHYDLCVVGAGSGGFGAALAAARSGLSVALIERASLLGGNAIHGGVNAWESVVGGTAFPFELYRRLKSVPDAVGISSYGRHCLWPDRNDPPFPGGELLVDETLGYEDSLKRHGTKGLLLDAEKVREQWHSVVFEPEACAKAMKEMLDETGRCDVFFETSFQSAELAESGTVIGLRISGPTGEATLRARYFIDATADIYLCRAAGFETRIGPETFARFQEPSAPKEICGRRVNGVSLIYRVKRVETAAVEALPAEAYIDCPFRDIWPYAHIFEYPNGDRNINMLPTMEGEEYLSIAASRDEGRRLAYEECRRRVYGHWHWIQREFPEFQRFRMSWIAPTAGVRETHRVVAEYQLTERDLVAGLSRQDHSDIIAIADHARDVHGEESQGCIEFSEPYGVPYRCLIPKGSKNLLVACRGAGFSQIAASSCRLSRTMMDLGHAAGLAVSLAAESDDCVAKVDANRLRELLEEQGATLEYGT